MYKLRGLLLSIAFSLAFLPPVFANALQGVVESVDASNNTIVLSDPATGTGQTIHVHSKVISGLKKGDVVKATLKSGSDQADTVEVLIAR